PHPVDVAMALVAEDNDGYFARYHALAAGADRNFLRSRVRSGRYVQHTYRVFSFPGVGRTPRRDLRVALLDAGAGHP
ncbi:MAG TPA: hypothetical protein VFV35_04930, partial [Acidimicrobiales bacterium]|nr:hypothetical protein [Acidimicrobiales bacterium]